jgi:hypothetical protein
MWFQMMEKNQSAEKSTKFQKHVWASATILNRFSGANVMLNVNLKQINTMLI